MMNLHGADIFIWSPTTPDLPKKHGPFELIFISSRGTRIWPPPAPDTEAIDWPQCRYLAEGEVTDPQIDELVQSLTALGLKWTKVQKLFKKDGVNQFSQPY
jgi:hypothetical protein